MSVPGSRERETPVREETARAVTSRGDFSLIYVISFNTPPNLCLTMWNHLHDCSGSFIIKNSSLKVLHRDFNENLKCKLTKR